MNRSSLLVSLLALGLAIGGAAHAEVVYRWVDENGVVHFGGTPPEGVEATLVDAGISSGGLTAPERETPAGGNASGDEEPEISYAEQRRRERAERRAEQRQAAAETARECAAMQRQLNALEPGPRVIVEDENGNPVRLPDEDRLAALDRARSYLAENCTGR